MGMPGKRKPTYEEVTMASTAEALANELIAVAAKYVIDEHDDPLFMAIIASGFGGAINFYTNQGDPDFATAVMTCCGFEVTPP
jgi:hypothetical protein